MAAMPEETKQKIAEGVRKAYQSPSVRKRHRAGSRRAWTLARRAALSRERREFWRKWREVRTAGAAGVEQFVAT